MKVPVVPSPILTGFLSLYFHANFTVRTLSFFLQIVHTNFCPGGRLSITLGTYLSRKPFITGVFMGNLKKFNILNRYLYKTTFGNRLTGIQL